MSRVLCRTYPGAPRRQYICLRKQQLAQNHTPAKPPHLDIATLLSKPSWSVRSLLSDTTTQPTTADSITPKTLHHLLRLSALPLPTSPAQECALLATLESQLLFVRAIQAVDTDGIEPLQAIRDETADGERERTIGLDDLKEALGREDVVGRMRRPRRRRGKGRKEKEWDVLETAGEVVENGIGRYFVVRSGKEKRGEEK
ncbi:DUF726 domain protein [Calycina marina]|uniref:DUF726 domain protein n=1 Tax=Calycina marina TaxID=1763456 RepID=A0A9P7Z7B2_9HELO|nr:DUF726 domain protein [Calycina marina]